MAAGCGGTAGTQKSASLGSCSTGAVQSCFLPDRPLPDDQVMCTEGTRVCRAGAWSACEHTHEYLAPAATDRQQLVNNTPGGLPTCSICDILCFKAVDNLLSDAGTADGSVAFATGGGLTLQAADAGPGDAGPTLSECMTLSLCCSSLVGTLNSACNSTASANVAANCQSDLATYCPSGTITGPVSGCTLGTGADSDCDGIPNVVDSTVGPPFSSTNNQTIFHQLGVGDSASNDIDVAYKLSDADVYLLLDTTGTMGPERQNLEDLLTTGNLADCAQLDQCCGSDTTCAGIVAANNATDCHSAQLTYCSGYANCADTDGDGAPNNELKALGVVGGIRCVVGSAWFGLGQFRELPAHSEPEQVPCLAEGCRYGDRDEQLFRNLVDMTVDYNRVRSALAGVQMNYNWDEPEGGFLALNSVVTGRGHYFGIDRPAVADRSAGEGCAPGSFGYPCFRGDAIPIVVMFTDAPHHNGPGNSTSDPSNCSGRGAGCPYQDLTSLNVWNSSATDSASDGTAHFVSAQSEAATSAVDFGEISGRYLSVVGDTTYMNPDYQGSAVGCGAADAAADALLRFELGDRGGDVDINFHLTKNNAYSDSFYGQWVPWSLAPGSDDPTPATQFGSVVSVFRGTPDDLGGSGTLVKCVSDAQPSTLQGSNWDTKAVDFTVKLKDNSTYYVAIKGVRASDRGGFQLQFGETSAKIKASYTAPTWSETRAAVQASGVRVLPVLATGGGTSTFDGTARAQAKLIAQVSGAVRQDGTPIWHEIQNDGSATGQAIVTSVAELAQHLAMNVSLVAVDGPDPGASLFGISVTPQNSPGCLVPHPLVASDGSCVSSGPTYNCNTQYNCRPGAEPKYRVTFTNPTSAPVPLNPMNPYGGYLFKLQLKGNDKYLLAEIPVFLIPMTQLPPAPGIVYNTTGVYEQEVDDTGCKMGASTDAGTAVDLNSSSLPSWSDLYFNADIPQGTSLDFELCTAESSAALSSCVWNADGGPRPKITVSTYGACTTDSDCLNVPGYGSGLCTNGSCRFINAAKIFPDLSCSDDSQCPNGPLGAGKYLIRSRCETTPGAYGYGACVALSEPVDLGSTLLSSQNGQAFAKVHITFHSDELMTHTPTLYDWYLTYNCHTAL
jgi:hypothetical protein